MEADIMIDRVIVKGRLQDLTDMRNSIDVKSRPTFPDSKGFVTPQELARCEMVAVTVSD
jgi:hypothetical protein